MRKIDILDKNYKKAALDVVVYENKTLRDIFEDGVAFDVDPPQNKYDYWQRIYNYLAFGTKEAGYLYAPNGPSKYDVAYVNKTIDDPIAELNGHTLREVFEDVNLTDYTVMSSRNMTKTVNTGYNSYEVLDNTSEISSFMTFNEDTSVNDYFYIKTKVSNISDSSQKVIVHIGQSAPYTTLLQYIKTGNYEHSTIIQRTGGDIYFRYGFTMIYQETSLGVTFDYEVIGINMSSLGISPTTDMDYYYSLYQARKNITKKVLTYADIFEGFNLTKNPTLEEDTAGWLHNGVYDNGHITVNRNASYDIIKQNMQITKDKTYFISIDIKTSLNYQIYYWGSTNHGSIVVPRSGVFERYSELKTFNVSDYSMGFDMYIGSIVNILWSVDNYFVVPKENFDELITKEQLDTMLNYYLQIKNVVIYYDLFVIEEPIGLGSKFKMLTSGKYTYGHEMDFEDITLKIHFGINFNAYEGYNLLRQFIADNKCVIEYDWGKGSRYADVRLLRAPKTEKDSLNLLTNKWQFKHEEPWYILHEETGTTGIIITNTHEKVIKPKIEFTASSSVVTIELDNGPIEVIDFDFSGVTLPATVIIDPEENTITFADGTNAYGYLNLSYNSFFEVPGDGDNYTLNISGATSMKVTWKEWVVD